MCVGELKILILDAGRPFSFENLYQRSTGGTMYIVRVNGLRSNKGNVVF